MTSDERNVWLAGLAVGDTVALDVSGYGTSTPSWAPFRVKKIGKRDIVIASDKRGERRISRASGCETRSGVWDFCGSIRPVDNEVRESWRRTKALNAIRKVDWSVLDTDALERVLAAIGGVP